MTSTVGTDIASRMRKLSGEFSRFQPEAVKRGSLDIKRAVEHELRRAVGADMRMSGVGNAKLGVRFDLKGTRNPTSLIRAVGPWQLIERDTKPRTIFVRAGRTARTRGRGSGAANRAARRQDVQNRLDQAFGGVGAYRFGTLRFQGRSGLAFRRVVRHPGTKGKAPFAKGLAVGVPVARRTVRNGARDAAIRGFR